jgi:hypothetical protein
MSHEVVNDTVVVNAPAGEHVTVPTTGEITPKPIRVAHLVHHRPLLCEKGLLLDNLDGERKTPYFLAVEALGATASNEIDIFEFFSAARDKYSSDGIVFDALLMLIYKIGIGNYPMESIQDKEHARAIVEVAYKLGFKADSVDQKELFDMAMPFSVDEDGIDAFKWGDEYKDIFPSCDARFKEVASIWAVTRLEEFDEISFMDDDVPDSAQVLVLKSVEYALRKKNAIANELIDKLHAERAASVQASAREKARVDLFRTSRKRERDVKGDEILQTKRITKTEFRCYADLAKLCD